MYGRIWRGAKFILAIYWRLSLLKFNLALRETIGRFRSRCLRRSEARLAYLILFFKRGNRRHLFSLADSGMWNGSVMLFRRRRCAENLKSARADIGKIMRRTGFCRKIGRA